jgi:DNA-binding NarL/FixJ family response regulator
VANETPVLIISRSAQFRESLQVLVQASPQVGLVRVAEDGPTARGMAGAIEPALILLDWDLTNGAMRMMLDPLRARWPGSRYVVFVESERDRRLAKEAGADVVLVKGVLAATILERIDGLLSNEL